MGTNINNFNFNKLDLQLSNYKYWDFYLHPWDNDGSVCGTPVNRLDDCLLSYFDFNNSNIFLNGVNGNSDLLSLTSWDEATVSGVTLSNIGLTGIDNGLIPFVKDINDFTNQTLVNTLTGSSYTISSGTTELVLNPVSGSTGVFEYPIEVVSDISGNVSKLCGGFYQGFYKIDGDNYQVLPERFNKGWGVEFWLKKEDTCVKSGNTLNDTYPNNKGIFFYLGTRAENKFWSRFEGNNTGLTESCLVTPENIGIPITNLCTPIKETDIFLENNDSNNISLSPPNIIWTDVDNKFLIYNRGKDGLRAGCAEDEMDFKISGFSQEVTDNRNKFMTFHRGRGGLRSSNGYGVRCGRSSTTISGETGLLACGYSGDTQPIEEIDYKADLINNALGFRITDDCRIGYRNLTLDKNCESSGTTGLTVNEGYSEPNIIEENVWSHIFIRFVYDINYDDCELKSGKIRKGKLMFYINGKLKHIERDVEEIVPRRLNDDPIKQQSVPFNISVGGGTQGLEESMTFDGQDPKDKNLELITNFGGSFIGCVSQFKFYGCNMSYCDIDNLYESQKNRYFNNGILRLGIFTRVFDNTFN